MAVNLVDSKLDNFDHLLYAVRLEKFSEVSPGWYSAATMFTPARSNLFCVLSREWLGFLYISRSPTKVLGYSAPCYILLFSSVARSTYSSMVSDNCVLKERPRRNNTVATKTRRIRDRFWEKLYTFMAI